MNAREEWGEMGESAGKGSVVRMGLGCSVAGSTEIRRVLGVSQEVEDSWGWVCN